MYPYPLKDKVKGATKPKTFHLVIPRADASEIKKLALQRYAINFNDFAVSILSYRMTRELEKNPVKGLVK